MSKKDKLIRKLKSNPKDFTFDECENLLSYLGYNRLNKGKTSGSRVMFENELTRNKILLHKPHPNNEMKMYQIKQLTENLTQEGLI